MELLVKNRYQAVKIIGEGGFGKTFLAIDTHSQNQYRCVIKQLLNTSTSSQSKKLATIYCGNSSFTISQY